MSGMGNDYVPPLRKLLGDLQSVNERNSNVPTATTGTQPTRPSRTVLKKKPEIIDGRAVSAVNTALSPQHKLKIVHAGVKSLKHYPGNARKGNVPLLVESLKELGQFKPLVVWRKNRQVLAGNHTLKAARALGWETVDVVFVDVDDETALRINIADNRSNDVATYDLELLGKQLLMIKNLKGTGYSPDDVRVLTKSVANVQVPKEKLQALIHPELAPGAADVTIDDVDEEIRELGGGTHLIETRAKTSDPFEDALGISEGVTELKREMNFRSVSITPWQIPVIREDMLMQTADLALNYKSYVPSIHTDWPDPDQGWLILYRPGNTRGLRHTGKAIWCFFTFDEYFEDFWYSPHLATQKMLNAGFKYSMTPDFSCWADTPRIESLWALYKTRWLGRYMQEAGIKLVPHFSTIHNDPDFLDNYHNATLPPHCPVVSSQFQCSVDYQSNKKESAIFFRELEAFYNATTPDVLILYGVDSTYEFVMRAGYPWRIILVDPFGNEMHKHKETREAREILAAKGITNTPVENRRVRKKSA